jgi:HEAT repeat protein
MKPTAALWLLTVALASAGFFAADSALAQGTAQKPAQSTTRGPAVVPLTAASLAKLKSQDPTEIKAGLDDARLSGKAATAAAPLIVDLLQKGLPYPLAEAALDTLGDIESEATSPTLAWYARHRSVEVRRSAVKALAHTKGAPAVKALRIALSDEDPRVRGFSATGLGSLKAKEAVADLFVALDHKVNEAAVSIGQLCAPSECEALQGRLGRLPFDVVSSGLDQILFRPAGEVSDDAKVKLVGRLRELGTAEANHFLRDVVARWPATGSARVKQSIDQAVSATAGSPGSSSSGGGTPPATAEPGPARGGL